MQTKTLLFNFLFEIDWWYSKSLFALQLSVTIEVSGEDTYVFQPRLYGKVIFLFKKLFIKIVHLGCYLLGWEL